MKTKKMPEGKRFSSTYQPEKNGRRKNRLSEMIQDNGLSANDVANTIKVILPMTEAEMTALGGDESQPLLMRMVVSALSSDIDNGSVQNLMSLLNRVYGAPSQPIELLGNKEKPVIVSIAEIMGTDETSP